MFFPIRQNGIVLVPGFFNTDFVNFGIASYLFMMGHTPQGFGIPNYILSHIDRTTDYLVDRIERTARWSPSGKVDVFGYSLGGVFAYNAAKRTDKVRQVVTLASPLRGEFELFMVNMATAFRTFGNGLEDFLDESTKPTDFPHINFHSRFDGVVSSESTKTQNPNSTNIEIVSKYGWDIIQGGHLALPFSPKVVKNVGGTIIRTDNEVEKGILKIAA